MECVILFRNTQNGRVGFVSDNDEMAVFPTWDDALAATEHTFICQAFPWQVVELDELPTLADMKGA